MGAAFLDLASAARNWRGRWCLSSYHYPQGFSRYWILLSQALWPKDRHEVASPPLASSSEKHVLVRQSLFKWGHPVDIVHLPLIHFLEGFERPTHGWATCDRLNLLDHIWWALGRVILITGWKFVLVLVITTESIGFPLFHILLQFPFPYKLLYLFL